VGVEIDPTRIKRRLETRYLDEQADDLDDALARCQRYAQRGEARSVAVCGNAADVYQELVRRNVTPDLVTDQTSAHDPLRGYIPRDVTLDGAEELRQRDPDGYIKRSRESMAQQVRAMLELKARGAHVFDYGNNIRAQAQLAGVKNAFDFPGFVPAYIRPLFCEGKGPFRWAAMSGDPADIAKTDRAVLECIPDNPALARWINLAGERVRGVPGPAGAHLLAGLRRARESGPALQRDGAARGALGAGRDRARPSGLGLGGLAQSRDRGHARRLRCHRRLADPERAGQL